MDIKSFGIKPLKKFIKRYILGNFFKINLTSLERELAEEGIDVKHSVCLRNGIFKGLLAMPAILFLDTQTIISVLIPVTLVAGTAWFSISLANVKEKFGGFGLELTINIFESFINSLILLILIASVSLVREFLEPLIAIGETSALLRLVAGLLGIYVVFDNIYKIFIGSMKYDTNDTMLTGQNEAAERFFKKSLSFLNITADNLREGKHTEVAHYYIGLSFFEIYTYINTLEVFNKKEINKHIDTANTLIDNPSMKQVEAKKIAIDLINQFLEYVKIKNNENINKSITGIKDELRNLNDSKREESKEMIDTRFGMIFQEIGEMISNAGENLFKKD